MAGTGTNLADYDSSVVCARNGTVEVSVPETKVDVDVKNGDVVVCRFTNVRHGTPPTPNPPQPTPPEPTPTPPIPIPRCHPARSRCSTSRWSRVGEPAAVHIGGRITWTMTVTNKSSCRRRGRERAQGERSALVPDEPDLDEELAGNLSAVRVQPRTPGTRSVRDRRRGDEGTADRAGGRHRQSRVGGDRVELPQQRRIGPGARRRAVPPAQASDGMPDIDGGAARAPGRAELGRALDRAKPSRSSAGRLPRACSRRRHRGSRPAPIGTESPG